MKLPAYKQLIIFILFVSGTLAASAENEKPPQPGSGNEAAANAVAANTRLEQQMAATVSKIADLIAQQCDWCTQDGEYRDLGVDLKANQDAWKPWAEAECELLYKSEGPGWNQWATARWQQCITGQSQVRLQLLENVVRCLEYEVDGNKSDDFTSCIRKLAPHLGTK